MPNPNIRKSLEKIHSELDRLGRHVVQYSGIEPRDAGFVQNQCTDIIQMAGRLIEEAESVERQAGGGVAPHKGRGGLVKKLRKVLGYTYP